MILFKDIIDAENFKPEYFLVFRNESKEVFHAVGFKESPDINNILLVFREMREDPEFGIGDKLGTKFMDIITAAEFDTLEM